MENRIANFLHPRLKGVHLHKFNKYEETKDDIEELARELELTGDNEDGQDESSVQQTAPLSPTSKLKMAFSNKKTVQHF